MNILTIFFSLRYSQYTRITFFVNKFSIPCGIDGFLLVLPVGISLLLALSESVN